MLYIYIYIYLVRYCGNELHMNINSRADDVGVHACVKLA